MLREVENKIQELRQQKKGEYYKQKDIDLENWGLKSNKKNQPALIVTDDEYEALVEAASGLKDGGRNLTATVLNVLSVVVITLGVVAGISFAVSSNSDLKFVWLSASIIGALVLSLIIRGLAVAINLLQQLVDAKRIEDFKKLHDETKEVFPEEQPEVNNQFTNAPPVHYAYSGSQTAYQGSQPAYQGDPKTVYMPR